MRTAVGRRLLDAVPKQEGPIGVPLLALANEVSGTTTLYRIDSRQLGLTRPTALAYAPA